MTQDEIIEIAQECKLIGMRPHLDGIYSESLVAFANLVAAKALAQTQEPVAWMRQDGQKVTTASDRHNYPDYETRYSIPLYTTPPQRTWVGLTDEEVRKICVNEWGGYEQCRAIEAKLKEKNSAA